MSAISYRSWDIWTNTGFFGGDEKHQGYFECTIAGTLMAAQTVQFLAESLELRFRGPASALTYRPPPEILQSIMATDDGQLALRIYGELDANQSLDETVREVLTLLDAFALAVDGPLLCQRVRFFSHSFGKLLMAARRPIGRAYAFEVEERDVACEKIAADLSFYADTSDEHLIVGRRHYLTGLQLLGLEDQVPGLIDAAFMQFYQGCEALCRDDDGRLEESKKFIARSAAGDSRELQIIAHHVWRVRNKYFGHGDVRFNVNANLTRESAAAVARQAIVARYLCKRLIDINCPSHHPLVREMGIYFGNYSGNFTGSITQLESSFGVDYDRRDAHVYDASGQRLETYSIAALTPPC